MTDEDTKHCEVSALYTGLHGTTGLTVASVYHQVRSVKVPLMRLPRVSAI